MIKNCYFINLCLVGCFLIASASQARDLTQQIKKADDSLIHGTFTYLVEPVVVDEDLPEDLKRENPGWLEWMRQKKLVSIYFDKDRYRREESRLPGKTEPVIEVFNGTDITRTTLPTRKDWFTKEVLISVGSNLVKQESRVFDTYPGPNVLLGRGLSHLNVLSIEGSRAYPKIEATLGKQNLDWKITSVLDASKGGLIKSLNTYVGDIPATRIVLSKPSRLRDGTWIAGEALVESLGRTGDVFRSTRYVLKHIDTAPPDPNLFDTTIGQGSLITDNRLSSPIYFEKRNPGVLTLDQILEKTRASLVWEAEVKRREQSYEQRMRLISIAKYGVVVLIITLGGVATWLLLRRK